MSTYHPDHEAWIDAILAGPFGTHYGPRFWSKTRWNADEGLRREKAAEVLEPVVALSREIP